MDILLLCFLYMALLPTTTEARPVKRQKISHVQAAFSWQASLTASSSPAPPQTQQQRTTAYTDVSYGPVLPLATPRPMINLPEEPVLDDAWRGTPMDRGHEFYTTPACDWFVARIHYHMDAWLAEKKIYEDKAQRLENQWRQLRKNMAHNEEEEQQDGTAAGYMTKQDLDAAMPHLEAARQALLQCRVYLKQIQARLNKLAALPKQYVTLAKTCHALAVDARSGIMTRPECQRAHGGVSGDAEFEAWSLYIQNYLGVLPATTTYFQQQELHCHVRLCYFLAHRRLEHVARYYAAEPVVTA